MMDETALLNEIYQPVCQRASEYRHALAEMGFTCSMGFYNNHSVRDQNGNWRTELFPIAVITVAGLCDIGLDFCHTFVETQMGRAEAVAFVISTLLPHRFEVYGVRDYLTDFYRDGMDVKETGVRIAKSCEERIGITFYPASGCPAAEVVRLMEAVSVMGGALL